MKLIAYTLGLATLVCSTVSLAGPSTAQQTWNFLPNSTDTAVISNNALAGQKGDLTIEITAWSSSYYGNNSSCADGPLLAMRDMCVQRTTLTRYTEGLGNVNGDEANDYINHSIDNNDQDYDMILLSFNEEVNISSLLTDWNYSISNLNSSLGYTSAYENNAAATVMAYTGAENVDTMTFENDDTWAGLLNDGWSNIGENFGTDMMTGDIPVTNSEFSRFWLVGAAHAITRDAGMITDHFKLAGVTFATKDGGTSSTVSAPQSVAMVALGLAIVLLRRQQR